MDGKGLGLGGGDGHGDGSLQAALGLGHAEGVAPVKPKPNTAIVGNGTCSRGTDTQLENAARQLQVKGKVSLLQSVLVTQADGRAEHKILAFFGGEHTVFDLGGDVAHDHVGVGSIVTQTFQGEIVGIGDQGAVIVVVPALVLGDGRAIVYGHSLLGYDRHGQESRNHQDQSQESGKKALHFHDLITPLENFL